jgi:hypothetical protein
VSHRPLVFVAGLTSGDYLLWNWSLSGNHEVLALVAGLTLPLLALATLWLAGRAVADLIARSAFRTADAERAPNVPPKGRARSRDGGVALEQPGPASASAESPRKIAA